jgi:hypothetical protein
MSTCIIKGAMIARGTSSESMLGRMLESEHFDFASKNASKMSIG